MNQWPISDNVVDMSYADCCSPSEVWRVNCRCSWLVYNLRWTLLSEMLAASARSAVKLSCPLVQACCIPEQDVEHSATLLFRPASFAEMWVCEPMYQRAHAKGRKEMLYCSYCSYSSIFAHSVKTHERIHTGERPFKCTVCQAGFTQKQHLVAHLRMHSGDNMFRCNLCRCAFTEEQLLVAHMESHLGERPFPCELCPKRFRDRWSLDRHQRVQHK